MTKRKNYPDEYRKIYGCPHHGAKYGNSTTWTPTINGKKQSIPIFICKKCEINYIDPIVEDSGDTGMKAPNGYKVYNTVGPFQVPNRVFIYNKESGKGICSCSGKRKFRTIYKFLLKNGKLEPAPGCKVCRICNNVFISAKAYESRKAFFDENEIEIIKFDDTYDGDIIESDNNTNTSIITEPVSYRWKEEFFDVNNNDDTVPSDNLFVGMKPASRVACAYYDAKIEYNPYQYLPWLKMFINESDRLLISDEVGLGKTIEAGILIMEELSKETESRILVICPAFIREKWYQELNDKFYIDPLIYDGRTPIDYTNKVIVLPVSRIGQYLEKEDFYRYSMVIVDEIHYFKNSNSTRYSYLNDLLNKIGDCKRVFMSATPVNNSGNDYHSIAQLFGKKPDRTNTTKKQAYIHLPERHLEDVFVNLSSAERRFYDATDLLDPFSGTIYRHIGSSCLYALSRYAYSGTDISKETKEELKSSLEALLDGRNIDLIDDDFIPNLKKLPVPDHDSKLDKLVEIIQKYNTGTKFVIFSHYIETVKYLQSKLSNDYNTGYIYANTLSENIPSRNFKNRFADAKAWFYKKTDKTTILICSDTCREGIDLDAANILINYDLPFNPSILEQRIGRIDRMNQKKDMFIYNFHVNNTYDDRLHFILSAKLRFIDYYADYGIGNPLHITPQGSYTFDSFIRYFGNKIGEKNPYAVMSNDDYYVANRILRQIGVKIDSKDELSDLDMQFSIIQCFKENRELIEKWFDKGEIKRITEDQLQKQYNDLDKLLGFPKKINRKIVLYDSVLEKIAEKANVNPSFRKRISILINDYQEKLKEMEISGNPMFLYIDDFKKEYIFGTKETDDFIPTSVIEILRNEGAKVYEIN